MEISDRDRRLRLKIAAVLGILFALGATFVALTWYKQVADALRSDSWPVVRGTIVSSELNIHHNLEDGDSYRPAIRYVYYVSGIEYEAGVLQFIQDGFGRDWAERKLDEYPVDTVVEVSYDPADPQSAVLESGGQLKWFLTVSAFALVFLLVFGGLAFLMFRDVRKMANLASEPQPSV